MKVKVSISMEQRTVEQVQEKIEGGIFRNKSHLIEFATNKFLKGDKNGTE